MSLQNLVTHVGNTAPQDALAQAAQLELGQNPNALAIRRPFDPTAHELEANFRLTRLVSFE
jgi:selenide,water dikinase